MLNMSGISCISVVSAYKLIQIFPAKLLVRQQQVHLIINVRVLLEVNDIIPVAAGWLGVVSTISRSARPVLEGWGAAGWGWNLQKDQGTVHA